MIHIYGIYHKDKIVYVGQTKKLIKYRFSDHKSCCKNRPNGCPKLYNKMNKHGVENFKIMLIETVLEQEADNKEQYFIKFYDTQNNGCNVAIGGKVNRGMKCTEQQNKNQSIRAKFQYNSVKKVFPCGMGRMSKNNISQIV